ncbi:MAG TPA: UvrD-helicase domain-containing protein [Candidatus Saccharibacteria bacterium]|nr:UvrD-helicase domain-containing protein [Candidatus Saccharibacteria bacterium]
MDILEGLNDAQKKSVTTTTGPLLILAGAGSGKTKALTHRIAYLIAHEGAWPEQILAVTFTNKAAREMRERLSGILGQENSRSFMPWMGTFHGICVRLLRIDGEAVGVPRNFIIYDEDDRQGLIKQAMKQLSVGDKEIKPRAVSSAISNAKNELVDPDEFESTAQFPYQKTIAKIYKKYEEMRRTAGALDFDDLLIETVRLFREYPDVRNKWRGKFSHILIDEYQDTNAAQYALIKYLVNDRQNIAVVGDDWQSIYSWRGADFTNILNFERDFPGATVIKLEQNYRSTASILDAAHSVILKNTQRSDKKLWTAEGEGTPVRVHAADDEMAEAAFVAEAIASQIAIGARKYDDVAVLYRTNAQSAPLERAFMRFGVKYRIVGGVRFYDRKEIKDILAYLKLAVQPRDRMSFSRIVNVPTRGIGATSLEKFLIWQGSTEFDIIAALANVEQTSVLTPRAKTALASLGEVLRGIQASIVNDAPAEVIEKLIKRTGYDTFILDDTPQAEDRQENLGALISDASAFASIDDFLEEAALLSSADSSADDNEVTLMTLHAAKGLEFPVVYMVGMEEGILPHARVYEAGPAELEEERRLCYVGMTRAREELHLTYAYSRLTFGQRSYQPISRFIADMGDQVLQMSGGGSDRGATNHFAADEFDDFFPDEPFSNGDRVKSQAFGQGTVIDVDGLALTIEFDDGKTKRLNAEYARLEKV